MFYTESSASGGPAAAPYWPTVAIFDQEICEPLGGKKMPFALVGVCLVLS